MKTAEDILNSKLDAWEIEEGVQPKQKVLEAMQEYATLYASEKLKEIEGKWISVKERYPTATDADPKGAVLGWDRFQKVTHKCDWIDVVEMKMRFTHWMPLPSSPPL